MTQMTAEMNNIFSKMIIKKHPDDYSIVFIKPSHRDQAHILTRNLRPFSSLTYTDEEVSVVIRSAEWEKLRLNFPGSKEEGPYSLITFDTVLDLSIVGFLSVVSSALADENVSIYAISTYLKDHILVVDRPVAELAADWLPLVAGADGGGDAALAPLVGAACREVA